MEKCPKCGGESGYQYRLIVSFSQWKTWDGEAVAAENTTSPYDNKSSKIGECVDCHYRFKLSRLE